MNVNQKYYTKRIKKGKNLFNLDRYKTECNILNIKIDELTEAFDKDIYEVISNN